MTFGHFSLDSEVETQNCHLQVVLYCSSLFYGLSIMDVAIPHGCQGSRLY